MTVSITGRRCPKAPTCCAPTSLKWSDEKLWQAYIQLTQAEAAFRIQKDQLAIRPIWHQRAERVQAHILVCFLAFVLWKALELWQARAGLGNSPRTLLEELARIQAHDVILPTHTHGEIRLRCVHAARCRTGRTARSPRDRATETHPSPGDRPRRHRHALLPNHALCSADFSLNR